MGWSDSQKHDLPCQGNVTSTEKAELSFDVRQGRSTYRINRQQILLCPPNNYDNDAILWLKIKLLTCPKTHHRLVGGSSELPQAVLAVPSLHSHSILITLYLPFLVIVGLSPISLWVLWGQSLCLFIFTMLTPVPGTEPVLQGGFVDIWWGMSIEWAIQPSHLVPLPSGVHMCENKGLG